MAARRGTKRRRRVAWRFHLAVILLCLAAGYVAWLDLRVRSEFEGKKWSLPARVYASPVEIYAGQALSPDQAEKLLLNLGYRKVPAVRQTGQYSRTSSRVRFKQRDFHFWDGKQEGQFIQLGFRQGRVSAIANLTSNQSLPLARLEPELIGKIYPNTFEDRILAAYDETPPVLIDALLAVEDRNYFRHRGVDLRGILRALINNIFSGRIEQGGSTLTQQLVKNFFLSQERTFTRKANEIVMALLLEWRYDKQAILAAYVNEVYLGQQGRRSIHGFGTAAEFYFAKPLQELRTEQLALLVGMVKGASFYNPRRHPERAKRRRDLALTLMFQQGYLDEETRKQAESRPLGLSAKPRWSLSRHPAFLQLVKEQLLREYDISDLRTKGLRIFTTMETTRQNSLEQAFREQLKKLERMKSLKPGALQAAGIFAQNSTGAVLALTGGRDAGQVGFNRALQARRSIGSLIKPFVYYAALAEPERYSILSKIDDSDIALRLADGSSWRPKNYDRENHGSVTLMEALAKSYNKATVRLGQQVGLKRVIEAVEKAGGLSGIDPFPSVLLGALELTPFEVSQAYQTLANGGFFAPLNSIREVLDENGRALKRYGLEVRQVLQPNAAFLTNFILTQTVNHGTGRGLRALAPAKLPLAGKTGTTNDLRDSWFVGFGDDVFGVVWLGRDDNQSTRLTGAAGAMKIWARAIQQQDLAKIQLLPPPGIGLLKQLSVKFEQSCVAFPAIPYARAHRPQGLAPCAP